MTRGSNNSGSPPESRINSERRRLLAALGTGVVGGIAGCQGDGDGTASPADSDGGDGDGGDGDGGDGDGDGDGSVGNTETDAGTATPSDALPQTDRTYNTFMDADLANMSWNIYNHRENWPRFVSKFAFGYKASLSQETGEVMPMIVKDWEQTDSKIEFTFREDSHWYEGIPGEGGEITDRVKPADWAMPFQIDRWRGPSPETVEAEENYPRNWWEGVTDVEWDDTTFTIRSEPGYFADFFMDPVVTNLLTHPDNQSQGNNFTTKADRHHQEEYDTIKDMGWEERQQYLEEQSESTATPDIPDDPAQIPTSGPFTVTDVSEAEVTMKPNPGFWNADYLNWGEIKLTAMQQVNQRNQALTNGRLDGINGQVYTPAANILDQLPDHFKTYIHNESGTSGISLNASQVEWFGDPRVRQAIYLALDKDELARQGHKYANKRPENPVGLIAPEYRRYVPDDLYDSFDTYEQDLDRASSLMEEAGFTMNEGVWHTPDGNPFSVELLADSENVQVPAIIQRDLKNFNVQMKLVTQGSTQVGNRKGRGEYQMAQQGWWIQHIGMWTRAIQQSDRRHRFGLVSDEEVDNWVSKYEDEGVENVEYEWTNNLENWNPEMMKDFTLPAPPVGERSADPDDWRDVPVFYYAHTWGEALSDEEREEWMTEMAWTFNWYLPYLPFAISSQVAVQNQRDWNAPNDNVEWKQHAPINKLIEQGRITAEAEE